MSFKKWWKDYLGPEVDDILLCHDDIVEAYRAGQEEMRERAEKEITNHLRGEERNLITEYPAELQHYREGCKDCRMIIRALPITTMALEIELESDLVPTERNPQGEPSDTTQEAPHKAP